MREVDQDFFAQPGAQQANDHQERKVDEVVPMDVPVAPVDDGSGEVDDQVYERGSGNKHAFFQVEGRHGEAPYGPSGPQQPGRESGEGAAHYGIAQGGFEDELLFDQKQEAERHEENPEGRLKNLGVQKPTGPTAQDHKNHRWQAQLDQDFYVNSILEEQKFAQIAG